MVTTDDGFTLPVPLAAKTLQCAEKPMKWMVELDKHKAIMFAVTLVKLLKECCSSSESKSVRVKREKMWEKYYQLLSFKRLFTLWSVFIKESIHEEVCPVFYQFVADVLFEEVVINQFPINNNKPIGDVTSYFSYEELNALQCTAGYVIKAVMEKVEKSKKGETLKEELILCLANLKEREERRKRVSTCCGYMFIESPAINNSYNIIAEIHRSTHQSTDWVNCIDGVDYSMLMMLRTFSLFAAMELEF